MNIKTQKYVTLITYVSPFILILLYTVHIFYNKTKEKPNKTIKKTRILTNQNNQHLSSKNVELVQNPILKMEYQPSNIHNNLAINMPSTNSYSLDNNAEYYSQENFDILVDEYFKKKRNGFFIEAGALDGESLSNTLFLEKSRNWNGLLIEPNPVNYNLLLRKNRKCFSINAAIATKNSNNYITFKLAGPLSGIVEDYSEAHLNRIYSEIQNQEEWMKHGKGTGEIIKVKAYSLTDILDEIQPNFEQKIEVDFFSLDTEGSEYHIIENIDFKKYHFQLICVEHNSEIEKRLNYTQILKENGFNLYRELNNNDCFENTRKSSK